jgi:Cys-tRNA(Pro)/Cys-tRNA(Cys) deacylase
VPSGHERLLELVGRSGLPHRVHAHAPTRTMRDAAETPGFAAERIVKTIAFRVCGGRLVLAALRGTRRVDYAKLAALLGVKRRDLSALAPEEVQEALGVEPGSVSPLPLTDADVRLDADALTITPTLYCGLGRPDRTLEIAPADLLALCGGKSGAFSKA